MSKKLSDLESGERHHIEEQLESQANLLGMDSYDSYEGGSDFKMLKDLVGLCANCRNLQYCKSEFAGLDKIFARCSLFEFNLSLNNRITDCNCHNPRGVLSLNEMYAMATLVDADDSGKVKGFISTDKKLLKEKKCKQEQKNK